MRAWSTNIRVPCADAPRGRVWFKAGTDGSAYEVGLVDSLAAHMPELVARPYAVDRARGWMLSPDEGPTFREVIDTSTRLDRWALVLRRYAVLQVRAAAWPELESVGMPHYRPLDLAEAWRRRATGPKDELERASRTLIDAAARLESSPLPTTVQHDDLHTGNIFVADDSDESVGSARIFDWGDAYVGHPFCSLLIGLRCLTYQYDMRLSEGEQVRLLDAYLEPWAAYGDADSLRELVPDAMLIGRIGRVLGWERSMARASQQEHAEWGEHPQRWLAETTSIAASGEVTVN